MFRYERPQAGRLRQFHQIGVAFGVGFMAKQLGIQQIKLVINSLGIKKHVLRTVKH